MRRPLPKYIKLFTLGALRLVRSQASVRTEGGWEEIKNNFNYNIIIIIIIIMNLQQHSMAAENHQAIRERW